MKIGHMIATAAACGFLGVAGAQAAEQASVKGPQIETGRSATVVHRNHHPAVVIHRGHHPHHLMYSQPHRPHHHPHIVVRPR